MHILIVTQYFWPESFPINDIAAGLIEQGHCVTVLTGIPNYPQGQYYKNYSIFKPFKETHDDVKIIRVPIISRGKSKGLRLALNYLSYVISASILAPFFCNDKYDVIYVYAPSPITQALPAIFLKWLKKIPVVLNVQDLWPESISATEKLKDDSWLIKHVKSLVKFIYRHCDMILVQSRAFVESIKKFDIEANKIMYFPNAAPACYKPIEKGVSYPEKNLLPNGFIVMFAGNIGIAQDFAAIVAAAEKLKAKSDIHFVILGDGRNKAWLEMEIKTRSLNNTVHLLGSFPSEKMPEFFASADLLLACLIDKAIFATTIPSKIQSYLACAKPIVAALNGEGASIIVEADAGMVVASGDAQGLAKAIETMYHMPSSELEQFGKNGYQYNAENFNNKKLLLELIDIFEKVGNKQ